MKSNMVTYITIATVFAAIGYLVGVMIAARRHVKAGMFDEIERHHRTEMRRIIGQVAPKFPESIRVLSPGFCEIYVQANDAESYRLSEVCGLGYGRALEFLVKDYAKTLRPEDARQIETTTLASCITTYITDPAIQEAARLATWLRNDQAHYVRRFQDKDIPDLKRLITMMLAFIEENNQRKKKETLLSEMSVEMRSRQRRTGGTS